jgi:hypothetical protein
MNSITPLKTIVVYLLRHDKQRVEAVQHATTTTHKFGIMRTHGLFGSDEWWQKIKSGKLAIHTLSGIITRLREGGMRDMPELVVRSDDGTESCWLRVSDNEKLNAFYTVGGRIEIDYVLQRYRLFSEGFWPKQHPVVIEIRIGDEFPIAKS